jgi:hypothetical protein
MYSDPRFNTVGRPFDTESESPSQLLRPQPVTEASSDSNASELSTKSVMSEGSVSDVSLVAPIRNYTTVDLSTASGLNSPDSSCECNFESTIPHLDYTWRDSYG